MLGFGEINIENLKMIGFKRKGKTEWVWRSGDSFNRVLVDIIEDLNYVHVSIACLNDSMHVPNAKNLSDITTLQTLFK